MSKLLLFKNNLEAKRTISSHFDLEKNPNIHSQVITKIFETK